MWWKWLPWKYVVRRMAKAHGFLDPLNVLARLQRFAQPSEVAAPIELLRAGMVFHARGLMNTAAIQHNLDWVWPYWVERQFDPRDESFVPRAFSITHVNLTHRNWTALGMPDWNVYPLVDPRGMITPLWDGWSIDAWIVTDAGQWLLPSRQIAGRQWVDMSDGWTVATDTTRGALNIQSRAWATNDPAPACVVEWTGIAENDGWLVVSLRPSNPEGVSFVHEIQFNADERAWIIDDKGRVEFDQPPEGSRLSTYEGGDVHRDLPETNDETHVTCPVGMATAAAMFRLRAATPRTIGVRIPVLDAAPVESGKSDTQRPGPSWKDVVSEACRLRVPDVRFQYLYDTAVRTLILLSPGDVYPGPYTYRRFWFRDAAYLLHALACIGLGPRARRCIDNFASRQTLDGYFLSQEGEWDSNGQTLWTLARHCELTGEAPPDEWRKMIEAGGKWILRKRCKAPGTLHDGLMPAGFSAEHLGPNDFYYWDDFWSAAGLRAAARLLRGWNELQVAQNFDKGAAELLASIDQSLQHRAPRRRHPGMPASPYRRMDPGAIGSIVAGYPLDFGEPWQTRALDTANYLIDHCFYENGFFQDMIHSGVNPYLTLHVAQVLLKASDMRALALVRYVAELASDTGQWPEAVHPRTRGGCMGDGQHAWASAEWVLMMRSMFVREESDRLVLGSGLDPEWLASGEPIELGPTPTRFGPVEIITQGEQSGVLVQCRGAWRAPPPRLEWRLPGFEPQTSAADETVRIERKP